MNSKITLLFLINVLFSFVETSHLRKTEEIPNLDILKEGLPTSYESLQKELKSQKTSKKSFFNLTYFKSLESSAKVKYYLSKEKKDFDSIINDIIILMGISKPRSTLIRDVFDVRISECNEFFKINTWMNYNIITTVRNEENTIAFGSLYATLIDEKYYFIFCYGFEKFNINFNGANAVFMGIKTDYKYVATSVSSTYYSKDLEYYDASYMMLFFNLVGFKVLGNNYNLQLPCPGLE